MPNFKDPVKLALSLHVDGESFRINHAGDGVMLGELDARDAADLIQSMAAKCTQTLLDVQSEIRLAEMRGKK